MNYAKKLVLCPMVAFAALAFVAAADASAFSCWADGTSCVAGTENTTITIPATNPDGSANAGLVLTDSGTLAGSITVTCPPGSGSGAGTVSPGGVDTVTSGSASNCTSSNTSVCPDPVTATAVHTPWDTQINGGRDDITGGGAGDPGWMITCANKLTDTCTTPSTSQALANYAGGGVGSTFDAISNTPEATCTQSGAMTGTVTGTVEVNNGTNNLQVQ